MLGQSHAAGLLAFQSSFVTIEMLCTASFFSVFSAFCIYQPFWRRRDVFCCLFH